MLKKIKILLQNKIIYSLLLLSLLLCGCSKKMNMNTVLQEPNFSGIIVEVTDNTITINVNEEEEIFKSSDIMIVSLDVEIKDTITNFNVGDSVRVYYNGEILETYPAQVTTVYVIILLEEIE